MQLRNIPPTDAEGWREMMQCTFVTNLNALVRNGEIRELIRVNESLHEKQFAQIAERICQRGAKVVMLAGPSSSGKTTSANRLAVHLRVHGKTPVLISLDDYYIDRDKIAPGPDGKVDLEHINTIDTGLFSKHMEQLLNGEIVELPTFNFITTKREWSGKLLQLDDESVVIVEGLHALNPILLPENLDSGLIFKLYISPMIRLDLEDQTSISAGLMRLLRRIVRDHETRGASVQRTMSMWDSVRQGEKRWILPFEKEADMTFNSATFYELPVLKKHIYPLLQAVSPEDNCYWQARDIMKQLDYILEADVDDEIPPTSIVREFIGGNSFYK